MLKDNQIFTRFLNNRIVTYVSFIIRKLGFLIITIVILNLIIVFAVNCFWFHLPPIFPLGIEFIPLITFLIFFFLNQLSYNFKNNMAHYKYSLFFPFIFSDDPHPVKNDRINMTEVRSRIKSGDILLRRYDRYIDGLIFSENSYFTHAGIYCSAFGGISDKVLHSEADLGVHDQTSLEDFCKCDNIAILRFSSERSMQEAEMLKYIQDEYRPTNDINKIKEREESAFLRLLDRIKPVQNNDVLMKNDDPTNNFSNLILDRAVSLLGTPYDLEFDFSNFDRLSCIEYVWYCIKFLYPLHKISVSDFEFFQLVKIPVIVPDVFIRNDCFELIYSSVHKGETKKDLINNAKPDQWQFWKFIGMILLWDMLFLIISCLVFHTWLHKY